MLSDVIYLTRLIRAVATLKIHNIFPKVTFPSSGSRGGAGGAHPHFFRPQKHVEKGGLWLIQTVSQRPFSLRVVYKIFSIYSNLRAVVIMLCFPDNVLSPPPHLTKSWIRPCFPPWLHPVKIWLHTVSE